jgi:hypothetical protein
MAQSKMLEGTGEELQRLLEQYPKERFRLVPLPEIEAENGHDEEELEGDSLYDLLGDYIGSVEGSGENNAERASELFTEYVVKKHNEGHL